MNDQERHDVLREAVQALHSFLFTANSEYAGSHEAAAVIEALMRLDEDREARDRIAALP